MAVDERARHELFSQLESALGPQAAETLMAYLPPVGWADVATKHDLREFELRIDQRFEISEQRLLATTRDLDQRLEITEQRLLATLRGEMAAQTRTLLFAMIGVMFTFTSAVLAAVKL
ncbi:MAG: hypothetical protein ACYDH6_18380 [Acidimicrobiales bacterium]